MALSVKAADGCSYVQGQQAGRYPNQLVIEGDKAIWPSDSRCSEQTECQAGEQAEAASTNGQGVPKEGEAAVWDLMANRRKRAM